METQDVSLKALVTNYIERRMRRKAEEVANQFIEILKQPGSSLSIRLNFEVDAPSMDALRDLLWEELHR